MLDVGCGVKKYPGSVGLDRNPDTAADIVCDPARMPLAAPTGSASQRVPSTTMPKPSSDETTARNVNLSPSPFRLLMNERPTRSPTPYMNR